MSEWRSLIEAGLTIRPISTWPAGELEGRRDQFRAGLADTLRMLRHELRHLDAERTVLELAITEADLRVDGGVRARAVFAHPGVVLSMASRHGPLRYATGVYTRWEANLRAIALSLEALRAVDRHGVTKRGEQYRGFRALGTGSGEEDELARGRRLIAEHGGLRQALMATHPDRGGDPSDFLAVQMVRAEA